MPRGKKINAPVLKERSEEEYYFETWELLMMKL